jgi:hypothetical protein
MGTKVNPDGKVIGWHIFRFKTMGTGHKVPIRQDVLDWCEEMIKGRWAHQPPLSMTFHSFYIEDKNDAMLFKLTWFTDKPEFR